MDNSRVLIRCRKCGRTYAPDTRSSRHWICPHCQAKNPNLKRHYRSIAQLFMLNLLFAVLALFLRRNRASAIVFEVILGAVALYLLVAILSIYRAKRPWASPFVKVMVWSIFALGLCGNLVALARRFASGRIDPGTIGGTIVLGAIIAYIVWLEAQARKCTVRESTPVRPKDVGDEPIIVEY
jgi:hypothetical protein